MSDRRRSSEGGFSLIEVLVATGLLAVSLVTLADLFGLAIRSNLASRTVTYDTVLAQQKVEELRATTGVNLSPSTTLDASTPGFVDHLDQFGRSLGGGVNPPPDAVYCRRWSIQRLAASPKTLVIQVLVTRQFTPRAVGGAAVVRLPGEARLVTVKSVDGN